MISMETNSENTTQESNTDDDSEPSNNIPEPITDHPEIVININIPSVDSEVVINEDDVISIASNSSETSSVVTSEPHIIKPNDVDTNVPDTNSKKRPRSECEKEEDGQNCPICLDGWTNSGDHRLCCLKCGHLFGHSCIIRWLQSQTKKTCPTCKKKALKNDIRFIYAKHLVAVDTSELDEIKDKLDIVFEEKNKLQLELTKYVCREHSLNQEIRDLKSQLNTYKNNPLLFSSSNNAQILNQTCSKLKLYIDKSMEICQAGGCRVFDANTNLDLIMVSLKSPSCLFTGFGLKKVCISQYKPLAFLPLHSAQIRDISFQNAKILTVSMDKYFKITDSVSNSNICSLYQESPLWSCCWDSMNNNVFYIGTQMGSVVKYDIRNLSSSLCALTVPGDFSPVVSVAHVPSETYILPTDGIVSCKLNSLWFFENTSPDYTMHPLPLDGPFYAMRFNLSSKQLLVSSRPNQRNPNSRHTLLNLSLEENKIGINLIHTFESIGLQRHLSRSCFITAQNNYVATHEESNKLVTLWNVNRGVKETSISVHEPVIDLNSVTISTNVFLIGLTDKKMLFYKFSSNV